MALALTLFAGSTAWAQSRVENRAEITAYGG
jgi:hypothetical protein